jgi:fucose 4-O-acetylase-like acetyltransferase
LFKDLFNSKFVLSIHRLQWIDYARGICIILVCYRHCFEGLRVAGLQIENHPVLQILNICFLSFRMPLFFIISGLFVSKSLEKKQLSQYVSIRFQIVFYPLLVWGSIQITLQLLLQNYVNVSRTAADFLNLLIIPRKIEQFWYLNALFFVGALYAFLKVICKVHQWQQWAIGIAFYLLSLYLKYNGMVWGFLNDVFLYYIFFATGDAVSSFLLKKQNEPVVVSPKWLIPSFLIFITSQLFYTLQNLRYLKEGNMPTGTFALFFIPSYSGCLFVIQAAILLQQKQIAKWLRVIGYHSLYIYLLHVIVMAGVRILLIKWADITYIPLIIPVAITLGIIIPIVLYNLCVRNGGWWLFSLKKPIEEINHYHRSIPLQ